MLIYRKSDFGRSYTPNLFVRIGLFLFGSLAAASAFGIFLLSMSGLMAVSAGKAMGGLLALFGVGLAAGAEALMRLERPYFRAGLEEALLYGALGCLFSGPLMLAGIDHVHAPIALFMAGALAAASWRYADSLLAAAALALGWYALFDLATAAGDSARYFLPPSVIGLSAALALAAGRALVREGWIYWAHIWKTLRFLALLLAYAGGNYFVIREFGSALFHQAVPAGSDIPLAPVFNLLTFALPPAYIAAGLAKRDRILLHAGLFATAMAVFTFRYYHHILAPEIALILAGLALIGIAWLAFRLAKHPRFGLTMERDRGTGNGLMDAESLALGQALASKHQEQPPDGLQGGGGGFGGGGASGGF